MNSIITVRSEWLFKINTLFCVTWGKAKKNPTRLEDTQQKPSKSGKAPIVAEPSSDDYPSPPISPVVQSPAVSIDRSQYDSEEEYNKELRRQRRKASRLAKGVPASFTSTSDDESQASRKSAVKKFLKASDLLVSSFWDQSFQSCILWIDLVIKNSTLDRLSNNNLDFSRHNSISVEPLNDSRLF